MNDTTVRNELTHLTLMGRYLNRIKRDRRFDATVRKAMESGEPLSTVLVDKIVMRQAEMVARLRTVTHERTEALK